MSIAAVAGRAEPGVVGGARRGVVFNPVSGELFHAARGAGAWLDGQRLAVNAEPSAAGALLATGFGYDPATHAGDLARVARVMPLARDLRRIGAASLDLAFVAAGRLDGYFERGLQPWDHAAGALLVTEAGGVVGGARTRGGTATSALTVASGPALFDSLLAAALGDVSHEKIVKVLNKTPSGMPSYMAFPGVSG